MDKIFDRVKRILVSPQEALVEVKSETMTVADTMKNYVAYVAAIPAAAWLIGLLGRAPFFRAIMYSLLTYAMGLAMVFIFGKVVNALAPHFNSTKNDLNAFKLAMYCYTPGFVAGVFNINPTLSILATLGSLYGIYVFYLGLPVLMETPEDKRIVYTIVTVIVMIIVVVILGSIVTALAWGGQASSFRYY